MKHFDVFATPKNEPDKPEFLFLSFAVGKMKDKAHIVSALDYAFSYNFRIEEKPSARKKVRK